MRLAAILILVLTACSACEVEGPHTTYCLTMHGFTEDQEHDVLISAGQWVRAGYGQVDSCEDADVELVLIQRHIPVEDVIGLRSGNRITIQDGLSRECLRRAATHETGHALARRSDHLGPDEGVMGRPGRCSQWLVTDADVAWMSGE